MDTLNVETIASSLEREFGGFHLGINPSDEYSFSKKLDQFSGEVLIEITLDQIVSRACIRLFIGSYFDRDDAQDINQLNADYRFSSFYQVRKSLLMEYDFLLIEEKFPDLVLEYYYTLVEQAHHLLQK